jgi:3-oxoacyl-[acyl-carrier protein] reductase
MERVALIAGGARGIGRAIALDLGRLGWSIAVGYKSSAAAAEQVVAAVQQTPGAQAVALQADVSDPIAAETLVRRTESKLGRIDALITTVGPYHRTPLLKETVEGWRAMFDQNLHPIFYLARAAAPGMIQRKWGRIVSFSMANADQLVSQPQITAHYIAKVGVLILTRSLAKALGAHHVTANAISPGFIASGSAPDSELEAMVKNIPAGYIGGVEDTAAAARFLLSDEARYVNGSNIQVSGGWGV